MDPKLDTPESPSPSRLPADGLARREALLKGLGKGGAALAVAGVPVRALATTPTLFTKDGTRCSISGMQSGVNSQVTLRATCQGKSPGYWHQFGRWIDAQRVHKDTPFGVLFRDPTNRYAAYTLFQFVCGIGNGGGNAGVQLNNTDEWHWCCAWMNAAANNVPGTGVVDLPYTAAEVVQIYADPASFNTTREQALFFFKKLEN